MAYLFPLLCVKLSVPVLYVPDLWQMKIHGLSIFLALWQMKIHGLSIFLDLWTRLQLITYLTHSCQNLGGVQL